MSIVIDGYLEHNTKDQTHERRNPIQSLRIDISGDITVDCNKKLFLSNSVNKQQFVNMLGNSLSLAGYNVTMHDNDADVMIVEQTLNLLKNNNARVIADDTDVFVLLLSKVSKVAICGIYLKQPKAERLINISSIVGLIQEEKLKKILLLHAMSGCDTTSLLFGVGKTKLYKKEILEKHEDLSDVFYNSESTISEIISAGEKIIMELYSEAKKCGNLNSLRLFLFKKQIRKSGLIQKKVDPRRSPPSSSAAGYHSLRVYHQIREWLGNNLDPLEYGWKISDGEITPVTADLPLAPEFITSHKMRM